MIVASKTGHRLVEQQQPRLAGERGRDLQETPVSVGKKLCPRQGLLVEAYGRKRCIRFGANIG